LFKGEGIKGIEGFEGIIVMSEVKIEEKWKRRPGGRGHWRGGGTVAHSVYKIHCRNYISIG